MIGRLSSCGEIEGVGPPSRVERADVIDVKPLEFDARQGLQLLEFVGTEGVDDVGFEGSGVFLGGRAQLLAERFDCRRPWMDVESRWKGEGGKIPQDRFVSDALSSFRGSFPSYTSTESRTERVLKRHVYKQFPTTACPTHPKSSTSQDLPK